MWSIILTILSVIWFILKWPLLVLAVLVVASILSWKLKPAIFVKEEDLPAEALKGKHNDWPPLMRWIPRRWSSLVGGRTKYPIQLFGSNKRILRDGITGEPVLYNDKMVIQQDVPDRGTWCLSWPFHFAALTQKGMLYGLGVRKDYFGDDPDTSDDDDYWTLRVCRHKL
jgi:hypothetical protein